MQAVAVDVGRTVPARFDHRSDVPSTPASKAETLTRTPENLAMWEAFGSKLDERGWRLFATAESKMGGRGGKAPEVWVLGFCGLPGSTSSSEGHRSWPS